MQVRFRPAAKGTRSMRASMGAFVWNIEMRGFADGNFVRLGKRARLAASLPMGEEAAWYVSNEEVLMRLFDEFRQELFASGGAAVVGMISPEIDQATVMKACLAKFPDANDRMRVFYYIVRLTDNVLVARKFGEASAAMGYQPAIAMYRTDKSAKDIGSAMAMSMSEIRANMPLVERLALAGNWSNIAVLFQETSDMFWTILVSVSPVTNVDLSNFPYSHQSELQYEYGILLGDLAHAGIRVPEKLITRRGKRFMDFAIRVNALAKSAVDMWLFIAIRLRVVKDIRRLIGMMLWDERVQWAETESNNNFYWNLKK